MTHPNAKMIQQFYDAFGRRESSVMTKCYHERATFSDPVFTHLRGDEISFMWAMLCAQAKELKISVANIVADEQSGSAQWEARYVYGKDQRKVHNRITATFKFEAGKIIEHRDHFSLWKWSRMALGPICFFLGWNAVVQAQIRQQAQKNLTKFITVTKNQ